MIREGGDRAPRVEMWVRETAPYGVADLLRSIHDRFRELETRDRVAGVDLHVWGRSIPHGRTPFPDTLGAKVDEFTSWADREDRTLEPAFDVRERDSTMGPDDGAVLALPVVCVALYDGADLLAVFPHTDDDEVRRVDDCLDRLERGEPVALAE